MKDAALNILVVEDAEDCSATLEIALHLVNGCQILLASTAEDALRTLAARHIAALVTDLHLPSMDGFELLTRVRSDQRYSALPIVVISGDADPATPKRILGAGADAFFSKPYSPSAVRNKLEELIHGR